MDENYYAELKHIRQMMEKSSKFLSLSGWSGIMAGIYALVGAVVAYFIIHQNGSSEIAYWQRSENTIVEWVNNTKLVQLVGVALSVFVLSLFTALVHSSKKAKQMHVPFWTKTTKNLLLNILIPLLAGAFFSIALLYYGNVGLIAPAMLLFYGISLLNGSKYTFQEFNSLGIAEIITGIVALFFIGYGLYFWAFGFGVLHIIYGIKMYKKYK